MKLIGTSGRPRHTGAQRADRSSRGGRHLAKKKKRTGLRVFITIIVILAVIVLAGAAAWKYFVKPPEVPVERPNSPSWGGEKEPDPAGEAQPPVVQDPDADPAQETRTGGEYTFALLGTDDGNGNTDTIMVVDFDANDYRINVVSIPRDTLVNVSWNVKKVNSLYGVGGVERTMQGLSEILGFPLDFYAVVDLKAFEELVDAIGGVYYDVPVNMHYHDPAQNLYIDINKGPQQLSGEDAVKVMRFRSGYADADIGRIGTQQDFLKTAAGQIMENKDKISIPTLAQVFFNYVETDLTYGNVIWLAREFFKMDMENINFQTLPANYWDSVYGDSYVTIYVDEWVEMINECLNPYDDPVKASDLNILTRDPNTKKIYSTSGVYAGKASWGN